MAEKTMKFEVTASDKASTVFAKVGESVDKLAKQLDDLGRKDAKPKVTLDSEAARNRLRDLDAALKALKNQRVRVDVDMGTAKADVGDLRKELSYLRDKKVKVDVQVGTAKADLTAISAKLATLDDAKVKVDVTAGGSLARLDLITNKMVALRAMSPLKLVIEVDDQASTQLSALSAAAAALAASNPTVRVDAAGIATTAAQLAALQAQLNALGGAATVVRLQLNAPTFLGELSRIQTELRNLAGGSIEIDADTRQAMQELAALRVRLSELQAMNPSVAVDADTALARHQIEQLERRLADIAGRQYTAKVDVDKGGQASARLVAIGAAALYAVPALGSLTASAASLVGALASLAGLAPLAAGGLFALGSSVAAIKIGVSGVGDTFTALGAAQEQSAAAGAAAGAQQVATAKRISDAARGVEDAQRQADRTAVDGARSVADARRGVADAVAASNERVASAEANVQRAEESRTEAINSLNRAIADEIESQEDLALSLRGAELSQEAAVLSLERARERLANMPPDSSALDYKEAELAVRRAGLAIDETSERHQDLQQQSAESARLGINGADGVVAAQGRVNSANRTVADAEADLVKARTQGAVDVARANEQVARAQEQASQANQDAARAVQRAQEQLAEAYVTTGGAASTAGAKAAAALAKLAPAAREYVAAVQALRPAWEAVKLDVQQRLFEGLGESLTTLADKQLPGVRAGLADIAGGFNVGARGAMTFLSSASAVDDVRAIMESTGRSTGLFAAALTPITRMLVDMSAVSAPILEELAGGFLAASERAADFIENARRTGDLEEWIRGGMFTLSQLGDLAGNVGRILGGMFTAAQAAGSDFLGVLVRATGDIEAYLKSVEGQNAMTAFFSESRSAIDAIQVGLADLGRAAVDAIAAFSSTGGLTAFGDAFSSISARVAPLIEQLGQLAGDTLKALSDGAAIAGAALSPIISGVSILLDGMGPLPALALASWAAFKALALLAAPLATLATTIAGLTIASGWGAASTAVMGFSTALSTVARALPLLGIAAIGLGYAFDATTTSANEAADALARGGASAAMAREEMAKTDATQRWLSENLGGLGDALNALDNTWINSSASAAKAMEEQRAGMTGVQRAQQDLTIAQGNYQVELDKNLGTTPAVLAAAAEVAAATDRVEAEQRGAADATKSHTDRMIEQADQALAAVNASHGYEGALLNLERAQRTAADATATHGAESLEAREANFALEGQLLTTAAAAGEKARADAIATGSANADEAAARAQKDELLRLAEANTGPVRDSLLNAANAIDISASSATLAEAASARHKDELLRLAGEANGPLAAALAAAAGNFDALGGANATAEEKARAQKDELLRLAAAASGPLRTELTNMANQIVALPDKTVTVTADGKLGNMFLADGTFKGSAGRLATGGMVSDVLPGYTPGRDVHSFASPTGGRLLLSGGEAVMRPEFTRAVGASFVHGANAAARAGGVSGVAGFVQRSVSGQLAGQAGDTAEFATGGIIGSARRLTDQRFAGGGLFRTGAPYSAIVRQDWGETTNEAARRLGPVMAARVRAEEDAMRAAMSGGSGWQWQMQVLRAQFPGLPLNSGFRPGAITATGRPSYHGKGLAVDVPPRMDVFNWIAANYGTPATKELIFSPAGGRQLHNGRPHMYTGVTRANHFDHVHWAYEGAGGGPAGGAGVERWRGTVNEMLGLVGQPGIHANATLRRMNQESGGNPRAINNWDSNAKRGTPSKGLMQVIDPTFRAYRHPATPNDIWDPRANIAASMRYALARYGSLPAAYNRPGGYAAGGVLPAKLADRGGLIRSGTAAVNLSGRAERMLSPRLTEVFDRFVSVIGRGNLAPGRPLPVATPIGAGGNGMADQLRAVMYQPRPSVPSAPRVDLDGVARQVAALRADLIARPQQVINQTVEGGPDAQEVGRTAVLALRLARR